jgi:hypothetical protein
VIASQTRGWVAHPVTSLQVAPLLAEYWKPTVPDAPAGLSEPGNEIETVALSPTGCPDTETSGVAVTDVVVAARLTVSVALGEVEEPKFGSPE